MLHGTFEEMIPLRTFSKSNIIIEHDDDKDYYISIQE